MDWTAIGSVATAGAVLIAAGQVRSASKAARTGFEDSLAREYRDIARSIPMTVHLGAELKDAEFEQALPAIFQYIDLSNQQVFLRMRGRIGRVTWREWCEGIQFNLTRPGFRAAWEHLKAQGPDTFNELRRIELEHFASDPRGWHSGFTRMKDWLSV